MELLTVLKFLTAAYPNNKLTEASWAVYLVALKDTPLEDVKRGVLWCIAHCTFFPSVAELLKAIQESGAQRLPDFDEAWLEVRRAIRRYGSYAPQPAFSHPAVAAAVTSIGWRELCLADDDGIIRGQFRMTYEVCQKRASDQQLALTTERAGQAFAQIAQLAGKMKALPGE